MGLPIRLALPRAMVDPAFTRGIRCALEQRNHECNSREPDAVALGKSVLPPTNCLHHVPLPCGHWLRWVASALQQHIIFRMHHGLRRIFC